LSSPLSTCPTCGNFNYACTCKKYKWLSFRIRNTPPYDYLDRIIEDRKKVEYRAHNDHWNTLIGCKNKNGYVPLATNGAIDTLLGPIQFAGVFLCRDIIHRREIVKIQRIPTPDYFSEQGKKDVNTNTCLAFFLRKVLVGKTGLDRIEFYKKYELENQTCCICGDALKVDTLGSIIFKDKGALIGCTSDLNNMKIRAHSEKKLLEVLSYHGEGLTVEAPF
jgi:hypothetical protein